MSVITEANYAAEAILAMKKVPPNKDGTIGFTVTPADKEWRAWLAYFHGKRMDQRAMHMRNRGDKGYMVPCRNPGDFDSDIERVRGEYAYRLKLREIPQDDDAPKLAHLTREQREAVTLRVRRGPDIETLKVRARQRWEAAMLRTTPPEARVAFMDILGSNARLCDEATEAEFKSYGHGWGAIAAEVLKIHQAGLPAQENAA